MIIIIYKRNWTNLVDPTKNCMYCAYYIQQQLKFELQICTVLWICRLKLSWNWVTESENWVQIEIEYRFAAQLQLKICFGLATFGVGGGGGEVYTPSINKTLPNEYSQLDLHERSALTALRYGDVIAISQDRLVVLFVVFWVIGDDSLHADISENWPCILILQYSFKSVNDHREECQRSFDTTTPDVTQADADWTG